MSLLRTLLPNRFRNARRAARAARPPRRPRFGILALDDRVLPSATWSLDAAGTLNVVADPSGSAVGSTHAYSLAGESFF